MERRLLEELTRFDFRKRAALCTVVAWKGSVPRKDFPVMLVLEGGHTIGTIGGGSMERATIEQAKLIAEEGTKSLKNYDFTNDDIQNEGGLCGGVMEILIEPYGSEIQDFYRIIQKEIRKDNDSRFILTTVKRDPLAVERSVINQTADLSKELRRLLEKAKGGSGGASMTTEHAIHLIQKIQPPPLLHIFGGGHVGKAVADLAHFTELNVIVYDDRAGFANRDRFPHAVDCICAPLPDILDKLILQPDDLVLVATRGHQQDLQLLRAILNQPSRWVGLVSSQRKWKILSEALLKEGYSRETVHRVHAPVGLDIQAETVPEIAVSIVGAMIRFIRTEC
jgi:xanthine dehydrogenase accessory factor